MKKLHKLTMLVAACGLTVSALAMAPEVDATAPLPVADGGWAAVHYGWRYFGGPDQPTGRLGVVYDMVMAVGQGTGGAFGALVGSALGPVGTVVGGGLGAL